MNAPAPNTLLIVCFVIGSAIEFFVPFLLAIFIARRYQARWRFWFYGMLVFFLFQGVTRIPAMLFLQRLPFVVEVLKDPLARSGFLLFAALTAGLFEEAGRWVAFQYVVPPEERSWRTAMMLGAGHGGLESIGIGLLSFLGLVGYLAVTFMPPSMLGLPPEQLESARKQFAGLEGWEPLMGAWERLGTMPIHLGLSVMVLQAFRRGRQWLWYAIGAHTLVDFTVVAVLGWATQAWGRTAALLSTEVLVTLYALLAIWMIFVLRSQEIVAENVSALQAEIPEGVPDSQGAALG